MTRVSVASDPKRPVGHAIVYVADAADCIGDARFRLRREGTALIHLGPTGWQVEDALLEAEVVEIEQGDLLLRLGPHIVNHLPERVYTFILPQAEIEQEVVWPRIQPLVGEKSPPASPGIEVQPDNVKPVEGTGDAANQPRWEYRASNLSSVPLGDGRATKSRQPPPWLLPVLAVMVLLVGGLGAMVLRMGNEPVPKPVVPADPPPAKFQMNQPCAAASSTQGLESVPVVDVIARGLPPASVCAEGERRLLDGRIGDGLLLLEQAASLGNTAALAELARAYDPTAPALGTLRKDARQAAHFYRDAERAGDVSVVSPRNALRANLEQRAARGDVEARLVLRQFWP